MRVHGEIKIKRRDNLENKADYHMYLKDLREDFSCICGYCGKSEKITKNAFEIDHFIPISFSEENKNNYQNLVYACYSCNRKKGKIWPTGRIDMSNDGHVGLVDPASDEYDKHIYRKGDGNIFGITEVGKYMCEKIFRFDIRPMREIWLCSQILMKQEILESKINSLQNHEKNQYIELNKQLKELQKIIFENKE